MKKQRILALTLAATTAMSMFAGMSVSAAITDGAARPDAFGVASGTTYTAAAPDTWEEALEWGINCDSYDDVVANGAFSSNTVYLIDYKPATQTGTDADKKDWNAVVAAVESVIGLTNSGSSTTVFDEAAAVLAKYYNDDATVGATSGKPAAALDTATTYGSITSNHQKAVDAWTAQKKVGDDMVLDYYEREELWLYNIASVVRTDNGASATPRYTYSAPVKTNANSDGNLIYTLGTKTVASVTSELAWLALRAEEYFGYVAPTVTSEDLYYQILEKLEALNPDDYEPRQYRKITDAMEDAETEAAKGTAAGWAKAVTELRKVYDDTNWRPTVPTIAVKYTELTNALKGLFKNGTIPTTLGVYAGDTDNFNYQKADYKADAWNEFAGYKTSTTDDEYIEGAYRAAWKVWNRCRLSSTRQYVGQSEVDGAIEALDAAILALDPSYETPSWVIVMLEEALEKAEAIDENDYRTNTSAYKTFTTKKTAVEKMLDAGSVRTAAAQAAVSELETAIDNLKNVKQTVPTATRNEFRALVKEANTLLKDKTDKTLAQVNDLTAAKDADVSGATISGYAAAIAKLETAIANYKQVQGKYTVDGKTYYGKGTEKVTGWVQEGRNWYYFDPAQDGAMVTNNWAQVNGKWYYLYADGIMAASTWHQVGGKWYRFNGSGAMITGWFKSSTNDNWYYLQSSGAMVANGWYWINGKCYYFYANGAMAANTTIGGWTVGADGAWIQ